MSEVKVSNALTVNFFLTNCSKFASECDWNSRISQMRTNIFFWKKQMVFFREKLENFLKIVNGGKFPVECVSNYIISWKCLPLQRNQKIFKFGKIRKFDENTFWKKKRFHPFKRRETNLVVAKYAGGSRPSCLKKTLKDLEQFIQAQANAWFLPGEDVGGV